MHVQLHYRTEYRYASPVSDNLNALRVRPATTSTQRCDDFHVRLDPEARLHRHVDYFGTEVVEFGIAKPHDHLCIDVQARVVTSEPPDPPDARWDGLTAPAYLEAAGEFLLPEADEPEGGPLGDLVAAARASTPLAAVRLLCELVPDRFAYRPGVTYVGTTVAEFLETGAGVCQDFVHVSLLVLRRLGIGARYVSGYLWSAPEDGGDDSVEVQTHAWLEALLPPDRGGEPVWVGADPTNRRLAGETHVKIGHGRRYADVPPIKGVYRGAAAAELHAHVQMTRLDRQAGARA
ncbi:transglutaminase family protein [Conexibacter sp. SYSU D00693]|uniref:transglutaminase family protein n=1 Tax=Conexibacter sp. SYSU D00693 TaxID=2812560 RepID=UPI00196B54A9|nr:transglutaminase family protein [Conexibacter sp. SYSU D00693]